MDGGEKVGKSTGELTGRVKRKGVYFNLDDEDELLLYKKANEIKNFSKWIKKQLINDGIKDSISGKDKVEQNRVKRKVEKDDLDDIML